MSKVDRIPPIISQEIIDIMAKYTYDPIAFVREIIGVEPDIWQQLALMDLALNPRIAVKAGHGVGKTAFESWALLWFIFTRPFCRIIATAPTKDHMFGVLWPETAKWLDKSPLLQKYFEWQKTRIVYREKPSSWFALAKTASKGESMAGTHQDESGVFILIDEGSGVEDGVIEALEGSMTGNDCKMLICGNPTRSTGYFKDCFGVDDRFQQYTVSCLNHDIVTRNTKEKIEYAKGIAKKYGVDSNVYRIRVLGLHPKTEDDVFIPIDLYQNNLRRDKEVKIVGELQIGADIARYGNDSSVFTPRVGNVILPQIKRKKPTSDTALMDMAEELFIMATSMITKYDTDSCIIAIDDNGVGGGVTDRLRQIIKEKVTKQCSYTIQVAACNNCNKVNEELEKRDKKKNKTYIPYYRWGDQMYGHLKDLLLTGDLIFYEYSEELEGELTSRKFSMPNNVIRLETKDDMKGRKLKSPDHADSLMLSTAIINIKRESPYLACYKRNKVS